jgi:outer membrane protein assembly factor BamE (lipoprotein component of BamABCDE complex)
MAQVHFRQTTAVETSGKAARSITGADNSPDTRGGLRMSALAMACLIATAPMVLTSCSGTSQTLVHGYQLNADTLDLVPEGSSREQALLALGTPSHTTKIDGTETFYYITQTAKRNIAFQNTKIIDQRILAIYFGNDQTVERIANYGLQEGKVFDFISRTTPTGGKDLSFLSQILGAATNVGNLFNRS